jgi:VanZ family protein
MIAPTSAPSPTVPEAIDGRFPIREWILVALWLTLIAAQSTDAFSSAGTGSLLRRILSFIFGDLSRSTVLAINVTLRKAGHFIGYAILAWLSFRAWRASLPERTLRLWALLALLLSSCVAGLDELNQSTVPTRQASAADVLLDTTGAGSALFLVWWWRREGRR